MIGRMRRVIARCTLLEIMLRQAIEHGLSRQASVDMAIYESRELRREIGRVSCR